MLHRHMNHAVLAPMTDSHPPHRATLKYLRRHGGFRVSALPDVSAVLSVLADNPRARHPIRAVRACPQHAWDLLALTLSAV